MWGSKGDGVNYKITRFARGRLVLVYYNHLTNHSFICNMNNMLLRSKFGSATIVNVTYTIYTIIKSHKRAHNSSRF